MIGTDTSHSLRLWPLVVLDRINSITQYTLSGDHPTYIIDFICIKHCLLDQLTFPQCHVWKYNYRN